MYSLVFIRDLATPQTPYVLLTSRSEWVASWRGRVFILTARPELTISAQTRQPHLLFAEALVQSDEVERYENSSTLSTNFPSNRRPLSCSSRWPNTPPRRPRVTRGFLDGVQSGFSPHYVSIPTIIAVSIVSTS